MLEFEGTITAPSIVPRGIEGLRDIREAFSGALWFNGTLCKEGKRDACSAMEDESLCRLEDA